MDISSLLNTDLGNLNDSNLILKDDHLSMYNTIYIFRKFTCPICKETITYFLIKKKTFFKTKDLASPAKRRLASIIGKNILKLVIPDTRS